MSINNFNVTTATQTFLQLHCFCIKLLHVHELIIIYQ